MAKTKKRKQVDSTIRWMIKKGMVNRPNSKLSTIKKHIRHLDKTEPTNIVSPADLAVEFGISWGKAEKIIKKTLYKKNTIKKKNKEKKNTFKKKDYTKFITR